MLQLASHLSLLPAVNIMSHNPLRIPLRGRVGPLYQLILLQVGPINKPIFWSSASLEPRTVRQQSTLLVPRTLENLRVGSDLRDARQGALLEAALSSGEHPKEPTPLNS